ncbi:MAG TPA: WcaI family glycosyltransferase [Bryobacteraceae bacterium]|jgi:colanic acid biosynthesis glycosyl transferase WcaI|nr:WcaI family glycosyltransferase [Bryobacteraceae bacterium]
MRILVHTIFYRPELTGVAKYTAEMCEWLTARGHEVEVVCPPPYYPHWRIQAGYGQWSYQREFLNGVRVTRCPIWLPAHPGGIRRILYALSFMISSFPVMLGKLLRRPDVVLVLEPSFLNALPSLLVAKLGGALAWLQIKDYEIDIAFNLGQLKRPWLRCTLLKMESWLMRRFDVVSTISRSMQAKAISKGVRAEHLVLFPDWVDTNVICPVSGPSPLRAELGIRDNQVVVLFSGTLNAKQGIETVIAAAAELSKDPAADNILFLICGNGPAAVKLKALAASLPNVRFLGLQPAERLNELLNTADIHVLPQVREVAESVLPSKLLGMLASGRPIVATVGPASEVGHYVSGGGILTTPGNAQELAVAVRNLAADQQLRNNLGLKARENAERSLRHDVILTAFEQELETRLPREAVSRDLTRHANSGVRSI